MAAFSLSELNKIMRVNELLDGASVTITEAELYEMARVRPKDSGLSCMLFVSSKTYVNGKHGPRIKVSNIPDTFSADDNFAISITHEPVLVAGKCKFKDAELENIFDWIKVNYEALMRYWNDQYESDADFYAELTKV